MIFYPLSGFIADIYCGRFKTIMISQTLIIVSLSLNCVVVIVLRNKDIGNSYKIYSLFQGEGIFILILLISAATLFSFGMIGYQANFIQFGLDQLLEAPSHYLGLFAHLHNTGFLYQLLAGFSSNRHRVALLFTTIHKTRTPYSTMSIGNCSNTFAVGELL